MGLKRELLPHEEIEMWERRDVAVDFVCSIVVMSSLAFLVACLL